MTPELYHPVMVVRKLNRTRDPLHRGWASSALPSERAISRGRHREPFSESRMRQIHIRFDERGVETEAWFS